jgi:hypothetical protein
MGTVNSVTSQLNSLTPCSSQNCCSQIDALKGQIVQLGQRVQNLESKPDTGADALRRIQALADEVHGVKGVALEAKAGVVAVPGLIGAAVAGVLVTVEGMIAGGISGVLATVGGMITAAIAGALATAGGMIATAIAALTAALPAIIISICLSLIATTVGNLFNQINEIRQTAAQASASADDAGGRAANALLNAREAKQAAGTANTAADGARGVADNANASANALGGRVDAAQGAAGNAQTTADKALGIASPLPAQIATAQTAAGNAQATADKALGIASPLPAQIATAQTAAGNAQATADKALGIASPLPTAIASAQGTAAAAQNTADKAISIATPIPATVASVQGTAAAAQNTADKAISISIPLSAGVYDAQGRATAAQNTANNALTTAQNNVGAVGPPGAQGIPGVQGVPGVSAPTGNLPVNPGKELEILNAIAALPLKLASNPEFKAAVTSAAGTAVCNSTAPGGCMGNKLGGINNQLGNLGNQLGVINGAMGALSNAGIGAMMNTLNVINTKLGAQVIGGISTWTSNIAEVVNRSQILTILNWIGIMHNAYFLSNSLAQTLFSAVGSSLSALGIKDTSTNPAGDPFNVGKIVGTWTDGYFKSIFGVAAVEGMKADWKKYSRIYQAAAQVMYSVQSIGHSILGALEVVGSHVSKIGNALQKFRLVGEKAYSWMNPTPFFQNRFFTGLQATQEVVSQVDQVASEVLSVQETITQLGKNKDDLVKSIGEDPAGKKADVTPEAAKVKAAEDAAKAVSKSPAIPESAQVKP